MEQLFVSNPQREARRIKDSKVVVYSGQKFMAKLPGLRAIYYKIRIRSIPVVHQHSL